MSLTVQIKRGLRRRDWWARCTAAISGHESTLKGASIATTYHTFKRLAMFAGAVRADRRGEPEGRAGAHLCQQTGSGHSIAGQRDRRGTQPTHLPGSPVADPGLLGCVWGRSPGQTYWTKIIVNEAHLVPPLLSLKGRHELDLQQHRKQKEVNLRPQARVKQKTRVGHHSIANWNWNFVFISFL